ncbi:hypothetical protein ACVU7I_19070, partial [Patulibacter sp. S7RM1-6]
TAAAAGRWRPGAGGRLPNVPEQVLVALVGILRGETDADRSAGHARARTRNRSALTGAFGPMGLVPTEVVGLVEQARAGVATVAERHPERSNADVAADLLVAWELLEDPEQARAIANGTGEESLLDALVARGGRFLREKVPARWTPLATLRLLWEMRQLPGLRERFSAKGLRSRGLRAIPVVGAVPAAFGAHREMRAFQSRLDAHLRRPERTDAPAV